MCNNKLNEGKVCLSMSMNKSMTIGILAGAICLLGAAAAVSSANAANRPAETSSSANVVEAPLNVRPILTGDSEGFGQSIRDALDELVNNGTITQAQADAVLATTTVNTLDTLVESGTITQEQADAIKAAIKAAMNAKMDEIRAAIESRLGELKAKIGSGLNLKQPVLPNIPF